MTEQEEYEAIVNPKTAEVYFRGKKTGKTRSWEPANFHFPTPKGGSSLQLTADAEYYTPYGKHRFLQWNTYGIGGVGMIAEFKSIKDNWRATNSFPQAIYVRQDDVCISDADLVYSDVSILKAQEGFHKHQGGTIGRIFRCMCSCLEAIFGW